MLLEGSLFMNFFEKVEVANFEVASDAFSTFKVRNQAFCTKPPWVMSPETVCLCVPPPGFADETQEHRGTVFARTLHRGG